MSIDFRFMVVCHRATMRDDWTVDLLDIVSEIAGSTSEDAELVIAVGAVLSPSMASKTLALMGWILDSQGNRQPGYSTPLTLPDDRGPSVEAYSIELPTPRTGIYGFDLFDADGAFGKPRELLATYVFGVHVDR